MSAVTVNDLVAYDTLIDILTAHHSMGNADSERLFSDHADPDRGSESVDDVSSFLVKRLSKALRSLWRHGWQPVDVVSVIRRLESNSHGDVVASAVAWDSWLDREPS